MDWSNLSPGARHLIAGLVVTAVNVAVAFVFLKLGLGPPPQLPPPAQPLVVVVGQPVGTTITPAGLSPAQK